LGYGGTAQKNSPTPTSSIGLSPTAALSERDFDNNGILNIFELEAGPGQGFVVDEIRSGYQHTCALIDTGSVYCWGRGDYGQVGNGAFSDRYTPTSVSSFGSGRTAVSISSSNHHTCAVLDNGAISCWGRNNYGQLGNGGTSDTSTPTLTSSLGAGRTAVAVSAGSEHTCAILDNGAVSCWGRNAYGTLGNGGNTDASTPTLTDSLGAGRTAVSVFLGT
jgi:alpha-tubulin suppressor-like RCC1 family protein